MFPSPLTRLRQYFLYQKSAAKKAAQRNETHAAKYKSESKRSIFMYRSVLFFIARL